ncbi:MAG: hypothetical protein Q8R09_03090, partial [Anaerolineaceae bacterium]|nr:hypothetical protein [Anaerolineaceae bacterium]
MMSFFLQLNRIKILGIFLSLFIALIGFQMIRIQVSTHADTLNSWASNYGTEIRTIQSERGYIYDRGGHLLAGNKEVYELGVELQYVRNPVAIATAMASIFGSDYNTILTSVSTPYDATGSVYVTLLNFLPLDQIDKLDALKRQYEDANPYGQNPDLPSLRGLVWTPHLQRVYPEGNLASNILGFYTYNDREKGKGYFGVEEKYDNLLAGIKQKVVIPLDPYEMQEIPTAPAGASLVLTIDREIQRTVEKILDKAVKNNGAKNGTIIVENPKTGDIIAMASTPRLDP